MLRLLTFLPLLLLPSTAAAADIFLVRHAEKASDGTPDPPLTDVGLRRAENLAVALRSTQLHAVYSTDYRRTQQTAAPTATQAGLKVQSYDPADLPAVASGLLKSDQSVLVVGHSNTTPELVTLLGGAAGPPMNDTDYDRVYVLHTDQGKVTHSLLMHLPPASPPPAAP